MNNRVFKVGDARITRIPDIEVGALSARTLFPGLHEGGEFDATLFPSTTINEQGNLKLNVHAWLVETGDRKILVDTGAGAEKDRPFAPYFDKLNAPFLEHLAALDVQPEDIDYVLLTHLHVDHVGWNTVLDEGAWLPTFPNAQYIFSEEEYKFFANPKNHVQRNLTSFMARQDSIDPLVASGQAKMIPQIALQKEIENISAFHFIATPGHSPSHASILLDAGGGELALFPGDTMHHPVQVIKPEINSIFDADQKASISARRKMLELAAQSKTTVFGTHISGDAAIRVDHDNDSYGWEFL